MQQQEVKLYDIYGVYYEPWFLQKWFVWSVISLIIGAIGYFLYRWYSKRKQPKKPYWQVILLELEKLSQEQNFRDPQTFYIRLTALIKQYLEERFRIALIGATDSECLEAIKQNKNVIEWINIDVQKMFDGVMFVKFANAQTKKERMLQDITLFRNLIEKTFPINAE